MYAQGPFDHQLLVPETQLKKLSENLIFFFSRYSFFHHAPLAPSSVFLRDVITAARNLMRGAKDTRRSTKRDGRGTGEEEEEEVMPEGRKDV